MVVRVKAASRVANEPAIRLSSIWPVLPAGLGRLGDGCIRCV
jgi:hypothetical protein